MLLNWNTTRSYPSCRPRATRSSRAVSLPVADPSTGVVPAPSSGSIPSVPVVAVGVGDGRELAPVGVEDLSEPPHPEETASRAAVTRPVETSLRMSAAYSGLVRENGGMLQVAPGLRRWTARHEEWEEEVGSLAVETSDGLVLIDPIDPPREVAKADHVLVTVYWHARSTGELGAKRVWASARSNRPLKTRGVVVTDPFHTDDELPSGIRAFQTARSAEVVRPDPQRRQARACRRCGIRSSCLRQRDELPEEGPGRCRIQAVVHVRRPAHKVAGDGGACDDVRLGRAGAEEVRAARIAVARAAVTKCWIHGDLQPALRSGPQRPGGDVANVGVVERGTVLDRHRLRAVADRRELRTRCKLLE